MYFVVIVCATLTLHAQHFSEVAIQVLSSPYHSGSTETGLVMFQPSHHQKLQNNYSNLFNDGVCD